MWESQVSHSCKITRHTVFCILLPYLPNYCSDTHFFFCSSGFTAKNGKYISCIPARSGHLCFFWSLWYFELSSHCLAELWLTVLSTALFPAAQLSCQWNTFALQSGSTICRAERLHSHASWGSVALCCTPVTCASASTTTLHCWNWMTSWDGRSRCGRPAFHRVRYFHRSCFQNQTL